jgi:hypothetical protein
VRICDFGIARTVDPEGTMTGKIGTYHYMAPEVINQSKYGLKADVFSYGMMLWEMITHKVPFEWFQNDQVKITTAISRGTRPTIPKTINSSLRKLIINCWDQEPDHRPTFQEILQILCSEVIHFPHTNVNTIKQFYAKKNPSLPADDDRILVMQLFQHPSPDLLTCLQRINNSSVMIQSLRTKEFVAAATPILQRSEYTEVIGQTLCCVLDGPELIKIFVNTGGPQSLLRMLRSGKPDEALVAAELARRTAEVISNDDRYELVGYLFEGKQIEYAIEIIDLYHLNVVNIITTYKNQMIAATEISERACEIVCQNLDISSLPIEKVTVALALKCKSAPFVEQLLKNEIFLKRLSLTGITNAIAKAVSVSETRECALKLAAALQPEQIESLTGNLPFLQAVVAIPDATKAAVLLDPLTKRQDGAAHVVKLLTKFQGNLENPTVLLVFANVASYFPNEILGLDWLVSAVTLSIRKLDKLSEVLMIVRGLASSEKIVVHKDLMKALTRLLTSAECDLDETGLLIEIWAKISPHYSLVDVINIYYRRQNQRMRFVVLHFLQSHNKVCRNWQPGFPPG